VESQAIQAIQAYRVTREFQAILALVLRVILAPVVRVIRAHRAIRDLMLKHQVILADLVTQVQESLATLVQEDRVTRV
jgi:hypothetical protein